MLTEAERKEFEELTKSPLVKSAQRALAKKVDKEKKRLYQMRWLKKQGEMLAEN